jgi:dTDP-4-amino-4,6-dideoxygalactose transaminase
MQTVGRFAAFCASFSTFSSHVRFHQLPRCDIDPDVLNEHWEQPGTRKWTETCTSFLSEYYTPWHVSLVTSATHALETIALLLDLRPGDEVIVPSFSFSSTANAFATHGASIVMVDSRHDHPNMDMSLVTHTLTERTRAIVTVSYGGHQQDWCDDIPDGVIKINDAAHCIGEALPLNADFCVVSLHTTKNISTGGEGGLLLCAPAMYERYKDALSCILDKGTNRSISPSSWYEWESRGSAFRMPEVSCLFLASQLRVLNDVTTQRGQLVKRYTERLSNMSGVRVPHHTGCHLFFVSVDKPKDLIRYLSQHNVDARMHYPPLHRSPFYISMTTHGDHVVNSFPNTERWSETLVRLPVHTFLTPLDVDRITGLIHRFYG